MDHLVIAADRVREILERLALRAKEVEDAGEWHGASSKMGLWSSTMLKLGRYGPGIHAGSVWYWPLVQRLMCFTAMRKGKNTLRGW